MVQNVYHGAEDSPQRMTFSVHNLDILVQRTLRTPPLVERVGAMFFGP